jgi:hypothetical protein
MMSFNLVPRFVIRATMLSMALCAFSSAFAQETINATFTTPDGGVTTGTYDKFVSVTVSGVGQSLGDDYNDAFYVYTDGPAYNDPSYYQLTFGTTTLVASDPAQDAKNFLYGSLPAYSSTHDYTFILNTHDWSTPTMLHFGVGDGDFSDNSGAYTITIKQLSGVPGPASFLPMSLGLVPIFLRRRRRK